MFEEIKNKLLEKTNYMSPAEIRGRVYPEVLVTDQAPEGLRAAVGPDRIAYLIGTDPLQIEIPGTTGIYEVKPSDIIFEAAGSYETAFRKAMKKYGITTLKDLDTPAEKKGFYNYVDRIWHSKKEKKSGESKDEGEFSDGLKDKHQRQREKMQDDVERAKEKDRRAAEQKKQRTSRERTDEELPLYSDYEKQHREKVDEELPLYSDHQKQHKNEVSPPARRHQAKGIKKLIGKKGKKGIPKTYVDKETGKRKKTNPWALSWAQYDKYGKPSTGPDTGSKTKKRIPKK